MITAAAALSAAGAALAPVLRFLGRAAPWIVAAVLGALAWHYAPKIKVLWWDVFDGGAHVRIEALKTERDTLTEAVEALTAERDGLRLSLGQSEENRAEERRDAEEALAEEQAACQARVDEAIRTERAARRIVSREPTYDQNNCPIRERVDRSELCDLFSADAC